MGNYFNTCNRCGAHLDPDKICSCIEDNRHRTLFQKHRENYEITERLGGFTYVNTVRTDRRIS